MYDLVLSTNKCVEQGHVPHPNRSYRRIQTSQQTLSPESTDKLEEKQQKEN